MADLLQFLEQRAETDFFSGEPLKALTALSFSENVDLQRSAALAFAEITEKCACSSLHLFYSITTDSLLSYSGMCEK